MVIFYNFQIYQTCLEGELPYPRVHLSNSESLLYKCGNLQMGISL